MIRSVLRRLVAPFAARATAVALAGALLAGCSSVGGVGEGGALFTGKDRLPPLTLQPATDRVTVQFLPFTGLPVNTADAIYRRIRVAAPLNKIELVHRLEEPATYRIRGHFVALGNETSIMVIFTWDVYDAAGNNVYRIVGQDVAPAGSGDAWAGIDAGTLDRLADRAVRGIKAWLHVDRR